MKLEKGIIYLTIVGIIVSQVSVLSYVNAVDNISIQNKDNREIKSALQGIDGLLSESSEVNLKSDQDSAGIVKTNNSIIDIPKDADEPVNIKAGNTSININLPELEGAKEGKVIAKGVVAYASESDFSNTVQANNDGSVRMTTIIDNPDAPTEYEYKVDLPTGGKIELQSDGSAVLYDNSNTTISIIGKPWAKDANGKEVKTWFSTDGLTLIQNVDHNVPGIVYPVVADPVWIPAAFVGFAVWAATACVVSVVQDLGIAGVQHALRGDWNWRNRLESAAWNCAGGIVFGSLGSFIPSPAKRTVVIFIRDRTIQIIRIRY
jgi:hypothetical protein